ncbi:hypothetical protein F5X98DRAFT_388883 [Xylaria grammica]|nr:hypothetical protein F5X98DRAFT_388883 [Xylaria grammica]
MFFLPLFLPLTFSHLLLIGCCEGCIGLLVLFASAVCHRNSPGILLEEVFRSTCTPTHTPNTPPPTPWVRLRHKNFPRGIGIGLSACHVYHYFFRGYFSSLTSMTTEPAFSNILPEQIIETALHWWSCRMQHVIDRKFPKGATLNRLDSATVKLPLMYAIKTLYSAHTKIAVAQPALNYITKSGHCNTLAL